MVFFFEWNEWKNPQFNFSSQNISIECNCFKWDGKETKILHPLFHGIWKNKCLFIKLVKWHFDETIVNRINAMMRQLFDENKNISKLYQWRTSQNYKVALWLHAIIFLPKTNSFATDVGSWWLKRETFIKESSLGRNMMGLFKGETTSQFSSLHLYPQSENNLIMI